MWSGRRDLNRGPPARKASHRAARATGPSEENRQEIDKSAVCRRWRAAKSLKDWWTAGGSNPRPPDCEPGALPAELAARRQIGIVADGAAADQTGGNDRVSAKSGGRGPVSGIGRSFFVATNGEVAAILVRKK